MLKSSALLNWNSLAVFICLLLLPFGALVRLKGAGMACPDWPLCHSQLIPPDLQGVWFEVLHRWVAGVLVFLVLFLALASWRQPLAKLRLWPTVALLLILTQALFGALTIWLPLHPLVVAAHLLFGHLTLYSLVRSYFKFAQPHHKSHAALFLWLLFSLYGCTLLLGGLNASTLSGYSCYSFPFCQNWSEKPLVALLSPTDWQNTLQMLHRALASLTVIFTLLAWWQGYLGNAKLSRILTVFVVVQFVFGVTNSLSGILLPISVLHSFLASCITLIFASLISINNKKPTL